ncbi:MAG: DUF5915 domain-containing protein, partial [Acidimicrobiia bacterium]|nr:DUF5915 domain-containing protein [Acidimicrobiia bacterium]
LGKDVQGVIAAHKTGDWTVDGDRVVVGGRELLDGEYELELVADDDRASASLAAGAGVIALDIEVTPELEIEGRARDLIRLIQQARRAAELDVTDRISLTVSGSAEWLEALDAHRQLVAGETLATAVEGRLDELAPSGEPQIVVDRAN